MTQSLRQLFDFISRSSVQLLSLEAMELRRMLNDTDAVIRDQSHTIVRFNRSRFFCSDPVKQGRKIIRQWAGHPKHQGDS